MPRISLLVVASILPVAGCNKSVTSTSNQETVVNITTSGGGRSDTAGYQERILGKWERVKSRGQSQKGSTSEFRRDGSMIGEKEGSGEAPVTMHYKIEGDTLIYLGRQGEDKPFGVFKIKEITSTKMVLDMTVQATLVLKEPVEMEYQKR